MTRWLGLMGVCLLAGAIAMSAQQPGQTPPARGGGQGGGANAKGRTQGAGGQQNQDLKDAREALQRDVAEGKRLQAQLKTDKASGDKDAVKRDNEALKQNRAAVKRDQARIQSLTSGRGRGRGRL